MLKIDIIKSKALELGVDCVGVTQSHPVPNRDNFNSWLNNGYAGDMEYLFRLQDERFDPSVLFSGAKSIIVIGLNYFPNKYKESNGKKQYNVASYAHGEDYHHVIRKILKQLRLFIKGIDNSINGRICVDTAPFFDKYWAQEAGLGWIGKHTNLVSRQYGNWLLLGSLIITSEFDKYDKPHKNHCGKCRACIDSCPTGAICKPNILDAAKCISYWTIESKSYVFPKEISKNLNRWVFGCDICLKACPFNRFEKPNQTKAFEYTDKTSLIETGQVVGLTDDQFDSKFKSSPISRPHFSGIIRNIKAVK